MVMWCGVFAAIQMIVAAAGVPQVKRRYESLSEESNCKLCTEVSASQFRHCKDLSASARPQAAADGRNRRRILSAENPCKIGYSNNKVKSTPQ